MNLIPADFRKLILPLAIALALAAAGTALIVFVKRQQVIDNARLVSAKKDRAQAREKLARISEEEREVKERIELYRRLRDLHIIGKERRLDWADAIQRIRVNREMLDVRYKIEPQKVLVSIPGKVGKVDFNVSSMKLELALLHEGDLLQFLNDLRDSGNAYVSVRRCAINRSGPSAPGAGTPIPTARLKAECQIDMITVLDTGAKA
jgi:hypothetical protein